MAKRVIFSWTRKVLNYRVEISVVAIFLIGEHCVDFIMTCRNVCTACKCLQISGVGPRGFDRTDVIFDMSLVQILLALSNNHRDRLTRLTSAIKIHSWSCKWKYLEKHVLYPMAIPELKNIYASVCDPHRFFCQSYWSTV